jgi:hypothetical protein
VAEIRKPIGPGRLGGKLVACGVGADGNGIGLIQRLWEDVLGALISYQILTP